MVQDVVDTATPMAAERVARWMVAPLALHARLQDDWRGARYFPGAALLMLISGLVTLTFYLNHPQPESYPDRNSPPQASGLEPPS